MDVSLFDSFLMMHKYMPPHGGLGIWILAPDASVAGSQKYPWLSICAILPSGSVKQSKKSATICGYFFIA